LAEVNKVNTSCLLVFVLHYIMKTIN